MNTQQWTAHLIGIMHLHKITKRCLAGQLGFTPEYVSMVLNGHRTPEGAEERFSKAVQEIIENRTAALKL